MMLKGMMCYQIPPRKSKPKMIKTEKKQLLFMICFNLNYDETARHAYPKSSTAAPHFAALGDGRFGASLWSGALAAGLDAAQAAGFHPAQPLHGLAKIPHNP